MGIEARGAKHAYLVYGCATNVEHKTPISIVNHVHHLNIWVAADSDDEAYGIGMKVFQKIYDRGDGWKEHCCWVVPLSGIDWVGRYDLSKTTRVERPY